MNCHVCQNPIEEVRGLYPTGYRHSATKLVICYDRYTPGFATPPPEVRT